MLHITPVVSIEDGKVVVIGKTRGKKAAEKLMHDKLTKDGLSLQEISCLVISTALNP